MWRRLFAPQKEEEPECRQLVRESSFGISVDKTNRPIARSEFGNLVREYTLDGHRANMRQPLHCSLNIPLMIALQGCAGNEAAARRMSSRAYQQVYAPNLDVPDGDEYLTRAQ